MALVAPVHREGDQRRGHDEDDHPRDPGRGVPGEGCRREQDIYGEEADDEGAQEGPPTSRLPECSRRRD